MAENTGKNKQLGKSSIPSARVRRSTTINEFSDVNNACSSPIVRNEVHVHVGFALRSTYNTKLLVKHLYTCTFNKFNTYK